MEILTAHEFYEKTLKNQKNHIERIVDDASYSKDPVIRLTFDTYPEVEKAMEAAGYVYAPYNDKDGKRCASFYPKEYENAVDNDD